MEVQTYGCSSSVAGDESSTRPETALRILIARTAELLRTVGPALGRADEGREPFVGKDRTCEARQHHVLGDEPEVLPQGPAARFFAVGPSKHRFESPRAAPIDVRNVDDAVCDERLGDDGGAVDERLERGEQRCDLEAVRVAGKNALDPVGATAPDGVDDHRAQLGGERGSIADGGCLGHLTERLGGERDLVHAVEEALLRAQAHLEGKAAEAGGHDADHGSQPQSRASVVELTRGEPRCHVRQGCRIEQGDRTCTDACLDLRLLALKISSRATVVASAVSRWTHQRQPAHVQTLGQVAHGRLGALGLGPAHQLEDLVGDGVVCELEGVVRHRLIVANVAPQGGQHTCI